MGFWQGMTRMIKGEPVFQAPDNAPNATHEGAPQEPYSSQQTQGDVPTEPQQDGEQPLDDPYMKDGNKIRPEVYCADVKWFENGDRREVWARFANGGQTPVFLDKISLLGQTTALEHTLEPGSGREFQVYSGDTLKNRSHTKAQLYLRLPNGDYFCAEHSVLYEVKSDGENEVKELRLIQPVRDI